METNQFTNSQQADEKEEHTSHNYVLRIWKTEKQNFKGYILDPLTSSIFPIADIPQEVSKRFSNLSLSKGALIRHLGCWIIFLSEVQPEEETP